MPWEESDTEIRHRVRDPKDFESDSFRTISLKADKPRVFAIVGKLKGETSTTVQALRFPKEDGWTMDKAKAWAKEHFKKSADPKPSQSGVEFRSIKDMEFKAGAQIGQFTGVAAVLGLQDLGGDMIEDGAFDKTLNEKPEVPILLQHESSEVIGSGTVEIVGNKAMLSGQLDMDDPSAVKVYNKLKKKLIKGLSIGFQAIKWWEEMKEGYTRHITELKLWEVSIVTFPMQPQAEVTAVKQYSAEDDSIDAAVTVAGLDTKAGRRLSAATREKLNSALTVIQALLAEDSEDTSEEDGVKSAPAPEAAPAGEEAAIVSPAPEIIHSGLELLKILKGE